METSTGNLEKQSNVTKEINQADTELGHLTGAIDGLISRLKPVLLPEEAVEKAEVGQPDKQRCEIDSAIQSIHQRIQRQTNRIERTTNELQI